MIPFAEFQLDPYADKSGDLKTLYENLNITEIWNSTTISSVMNQISFYTEIQLLTESDSSHYFRRIKKFN